MGRTDLNTSLKSKINLILLSTGIKTLMLVLLEKMYVTKCRYHRKIPTFCEITFLKEAVISDYSDWKMTWRIKNTFVLNSDFCLFLPK